VGLEYFAGLGEITQGFLPLREQSHLLVFAFDLMEPAQTLEGQESPWQLNAGIGFGLKSVLLKAFFGRAF
jgi:hypothetical protein